MRPPGAVISVHDHDPFDFETSGKPGTNTRVLKVPRAIVAQLLASASEGSNLDNTLVQKLASSSVSERDLTTAGVKVASRSRITLHSTRIKLGGGGS